MPPKKSSSIEKLVSQRDQLSQKIDQLQLQLDEAVSERFDIDTEIQRVLFIGEYEGEENNNNQQQNNIKDVECAALKSSFEKIKQQFLVSLQTPKEYDSDVPYRCSDDFADTSAFDDWTDQQLEIFKDRLDKVISVAELETRLLSRENSSCENESKNDDSKNDKLGIKNKNNNSKNKSSAAAATQSQEVQVVENFTSGIEAALRILFRTTEAINSMVRTVSAIEGAETGILLECRDLLMEHWHIVLGDEALIDRSPEERAEGIDERFTKFFRLKPDFGEMLCNELERIGKPFSDLVAVPGSKK
jgi:hypothetical protein